MSFQAISQAIAFQAISQAISFQAISQAIRSTSVMPQSIPARTMGSTIVEGDEECGHQERGIWNWNFNIPTNP